MHYLALDISTAFALYIYEKFGQGFASRGWSLDTVIVLEKGRPMTILEFHKFN